MLGAGDSCFWFWAWEIEALKTRVKRQILLSLFIEYSLA
jgi:hypothetical protein